METAGGGGGGAVAALPQQWGKGGGVDLRSALYCLTAQASSPVERTSRVGPDRQYFFYQSQIVPERRSPWDLRSHGEYMNW